MDIRGANETIIIPAPSIMWTFKRLLTVHISDRCIGQQKSWTELYITPLVFQS